MRILRVSLICVALMTTMAACLTPYTLPEPRVDWETGLAGDWEPFAPKGDRNGMVYVGHNTYVKGCDDYPGGLDMLMLDLHKSVQPGLRCLSALGPARKRDAARLATLFDERVEQRPTRIYCGKTGDKTGSVGSRPVKIGNHAGMAFEPESSEFPGFHINNLRTALILD